MTTTANPFAAPDHDEVQQPGAITTAGELLVVPKGAALPRWCFDCGAPATHALSVGLLHTPFFGLARRRRFEIPYCAAHAALRRRRRRRSAICHATALVVLVVSISGVLGPGGFLLGLLAVVLTGIVDGHVARQGLKLAGRRGRCHLLRGASPAYRERVDAEEAGTVARAP